MTLPLRMKSLDASPFVRAQRETPNQYSGIGITFRWIVAPNRTILCMFNISNTYS
jgi:hypothetical protein